MSTDDMKTLKGHCEIHGLFEQRQIRFGRLMTSCPACMNENAKREAAKRQEIEQAAREFDWRRRLDASGIRERFRGIGLEDFIVENDGQRRALNFAEDYAKNFDGVLKTGRGAIFIGQPGTGKTHLAAGIAQHIMWRDNRTVLYTTAARALLRVKETYGRGGSETTTQAIAALARPHLLILDEIGVQYGSDAEKQILFDVLNERYEKRRPTLFISNHTFDKVQAYIGERVVDRLREDKCEIVVFDWQSSRSKVDELRQNKANERCQKREEGLGVHLIPALC